jgi:hypothetical protein
VTVAAGLGIRRIGRKRAVVSGGSFGEATLTFEKAAGGA